MPKDRKRTKPRRNHKRPSGLARREHHNTSDGISPISRSGYTVGPNGTIVHYTELEQGTNRRQPHTPRVEYPVRQPRIGIRPGVLALFCAAMAGQASWGRHWGAPRF